MARNKRRKNNLKDFLLTVLLITIVIFFGAFTGLVIGASLNVPKWDPNMLQGSEATTLYDKDNQAFTTLHGGENRIQVPLKKIPKDLINAFIAVEDQKFYQHHGINPTAIARAILVDIIRGSKAQGASTITQQLVRVAYLSPEKTFERKIKEAIMAIQLENRYTKDEILEFYLNRIYFGSGAWGVQTAAQTYFGKDVNELNLAECSLLAGLVQRPNAYSPYKNYELAKQRQRIVLRNMVECGYISEEEAEEAYKYPLKFKKGADIPHRYGYCIDYVIDEADRILRQEGLYDNPQDVIYRGGLKIYTTIDPDVQHYAEEVYSNPANFPPTSKDGQMVQSAMVLIEHSTGEIRALIGGREYSQKRGFNRAVDSRRQPGSAFKPLVVYGPALERGYTADYVLDDSPVTYKFGDQEWTPENYDGKYRGPITMRTAVQWSVNVYAVKLADEIGIKNGIQFAENLGITSLVKAGRMNDLNLSTALGGITKGVSPLELAAAYGAFANDGVYVKPHIIRRIVDNTGNVLYENRVQSKRVMKKETAWQMTDLLQTVVKAGTGQRAQIPGIDVAGKTGTTQDDKDAWFVGYTPCFTMAVWMGYDKEKTMNRTYGGSYPARIFKAIMTKAMQGKAQKTFALPEGLHQVAICKKSGKLASPACPESDIELKFVEAGQEPKQTCDLHVLVSVCSESGKLATSACPHPVQQGFLRNAKPGDPEAAPREYCDIHRSEKSGKTVYICTDPRHQGRLYLANIPPEGKGGGCPEAYIKEVVIEGQNMPPYCDLPDHQVLQ